MVRKRKIRIAIAAHEAQLAEDAVREEPADQPSKAPVLHRVPLNGNGNGRPAERSKSLRD